jgi:hypothetical protein
MLIYYKRLGAVVPKSAEIPVAEFVHDVFPPLEKELERRRQYKLLAFIDNLCLQLNWTTSIARETVNDFPRRFHCSVKTSHPGSTRQHGFPKLRFELVLAGLASFLFYFIPHCCDKDHVAERVFTTNGFKQR